MQKYAELFSDLLIDVINGKDLKQATAETAHKLDETDLPNKVHTTESDPMVHCYIDSAFPAMLFMVYKYADSIEKAVFANANAGGENVARGALVGSLLGAYHGMQSFPDWSISGLHKKDEIISEIEKFVPQKKDD